MPKISLSGPAELLTIIPFHLGFQPARSVVVVCFHGSRLGLVARLDLVGPDLAPEATAQILPTLLREAPSSVALVGFEDDRDDALPLLEALAAGVEAQRVSVRECLVVHDGRWRALDCDCCPESGWPLPELADVPAVASYVALGHAVLPDRDELARLVEPLAPTAPRHDLTVAAIDDWQRRYAAAGGVVTPPRARTRAAKSGKAAKSRRGSQPARMPDRPGPDGRDELDGLDGLDGGDLTALQFLVNDALVAWGGVLRGDIVGFGVEHWLPAVVGPLRDVQVRDAVVGWLCPGSVQLDAFPPELVAMLEVFIGPALRFAPTDGGGEAVGEEDHEEPGGDHDQEHGAGGPIGASGPGWSARGALGNLDDVDVDDLDLGDLAHLGDLGSDGLDLEDLDVRELDGLGGGWDDWDDVTTPRLVQTRLGEVCRLTPAAHAAPLLSVVASVAWWSGDGARAGIAADRALELEPDHRLSRLVRDSLDQGLRPRRCA